MANEGANFLARVMQERTHTLINKPPILDFGTIQGDMSLRTDKFPRPIPQNMYVVCRSVTWGKVDDVFYKTNIVLDHSHETLVGQKFRWLQPGDRVLVAWVGDDACVIDLIYPATVIR